MAKLDIKNWNMILTVRHKKYWHQQVHNTWYGEAYGKRLKIWTPREMLQRLLTAVAQVKAGNASEN